MPLLGNFIIQKGSKRGDAGRKARSFLGPFHSYLLHSAQLHIHAQTIGVEYDAAHSSTNMH